MADKEKRLINMMAARQEEADRTPKAEMETHDKENQEEEEERKKKEEKEREKQKQPTSQL